MNIIETHKLTKYYGKARGIIDVDLEIREGEIFGFIGPNGAGKSTTIRTLLGLIYASSGSAKIFGKDITKFGPEIREEIGYLPSEVFYYDNMRVGELLNYSASFYHRDCSRRIRELCEILSLDLKAKIDDLSYGNRKKVGIVQGMLHEPKLLILDEPTGGLDPLMQQRFFDLVREENRKGTTVLFSSHILGEVQKLCDRVAIIKEGRIIKIEKISTLLHDNYKRFYVQTVAAVPAGWFELPGVLDLHYEDHAISFLYKGEINLIIKKVAGLKLTNLMVTEPDLEEIFLHYYEKN